MKKAEQILNSAKGRSLTHEERCKMAIELAAEMLYEAHKVQSYSENHRHEQMARMMNDPYGKAFVTNMTDQCFRSINPRRTADQLAYLIDQLGVPKFLTWYQRLQMSFFRSFGRMFAPLLVPMLRRMVRREASSVILPGETKQLLKHIEMRRREGVRVNLNHLGEAILGEEEAKRRLESYIEDLSKPEIECVSIKVSTIYSQISLLGWDETLNVLQGRLKRLYRAAQENDFVRKDGSRVNKFVYLDMEEYRDLHLTVELFCKTLDDPEFFKHSAGIVLQAYLPDSFHLQQQITAWAQARVAAGGAQIKIRFVKGANMAMEQVEASLKEWPQAPYLKKVDTDANYKRMIIYGSDPERARAVSLGIASHNLFDIAFAMILRVEKGIELSVGFEMLEGMADPLRRVVQQLTGAILLYCPAATRADFQSAVAYLTRRLDENTAPENFLRHAFEMVPGSFDWQKQAELFTLACQHVEDVPSLARRTQNRLEGFAIEVKNEGFINDPDTDWSILQNRKWIHSLLQHWSSLDVSNIPLVVGNSTLDKGVEWAIGRDPSYPIDVKYQYALGGAAEMELALKTAVEGLTGWSSLPLRKRLEILDGVADQLRHKRGELIGAMLMDTGKPISEGDAEVSEAIDFVTYYRRSAQELSKIDDVTLTPKGVVLVAPPWNFSCSIPVGGIAAALAAGNSVIFKPAPEAVLVGWHVANAFWDAGIGRDVLQFFPCHDEPTASNLVQDERIASVVLTGATATARRILTLRPGIDLIAETGGKNTIIITSLADRDLAIKDLVQSAFGYAGQKCSACSLAILEKEVYEDPIFRRQLRDAAASMDVGIPWNPSVRINPLIRAPSEALLKALTTLEDGEEWLLKPYKDKKNPNLWSPGIKLGIKPGSVGHMTEFFGPILGVMCASDLGEAIRLANGTSYGLTGGIHTLDTREQKIWCEKIVVGNAYINRTITGAIVERQPFGGCKESGYGPGAKAGGPNYVLQLMRRNQKGMPKEREPIDQVIHALNRYVLNNVLDSEAADLWTASLGSYAFFWNHYFSKGQQPQHLLGETNTLYYRGRDDIVLRVEEYDMPVDILRIVAAALTCHIPLQISCWTKRDDLFNNAWLKHTPSVVVIVESHDAFVQRVANGDVKRVRMVSPPSNLVKEAAAHQLCFIASDEVLANGRIELLHYLREMCISNSYHRYGYLGVMEKTDN